MSRTLGTLPFPAVLLGSFAAVFAVAVPAAAQPAPPASPVRPAPLAKGVQTAQIIFADGRRQNVVEPRCDTQGRWTAERDGRRTVLRAGEVVVVVDKDGKECVTIPALATTADPPATEVSLAAIGDPRNQAWLQAAEQLASHPSQAVLDALVGLGRSKRKELRSRASTALARLRTREAVTAAATAVLEEKDNKLRREAASVLFSVQEIFRRCDAIESVERGIGDKDPVVRVVFALLSPADLPAASAVLRTDGLKSRDHHVRESAALELGRRGDAAAGESLLIGMLGRNRLPGFDGGGALMDEFLVREQVEICRILGGHGSEGGKAALRKAMSSRFEAVREAAERALAAAEPR